MKPKTKKAANWLPKAEELPARSGSDANLPLWLETLRATMAACVLFAECPRNRNILPLGTGQLARATCRYLEECYLAVYAEDHTALDHARRELGYLVDSLHGALPPGHDSHSAKVLCFAAELLDELGYLRNGLAHHSC
jgi:hypothetical protein